MNIDVKVTGVENTIQVLSPLRQSRVMLSILSKAATAGKKKITEKLNERYTITKQKVLNIKTNPARGYNFTAEIRIPGQRLPLIDFKAKQNDIGTSVEILKGQRKTLTHSFVQTMKSGHKGVFERVNTGTKAIDALPIREKYTVSPGKMFETKQVEPEVREYIAKFISSNLNQKLFDIVQKM